MTLNQPACEVPRLKSATLLGKVAQAALALPVKLSAAMNRRRTCLSLHQLEDYMLKDIGISRSEIDSLCHGAVGHRVMPRDGSFPSQRG
jgi:uncharacterized protein YjiS (DUF1127 family)